MDNNQYDGYDVTQPQYGQQPNEQAGQPVYQQPYEQVGQPMYQQPYEQAGQPMYQQPYEQAGQPVYQQPYEQAGQPVYQQPYGQPGQPPYQQPYGQPGQPPYGQPPYQQNPYGGYPQNGYYGYPQQQEESSGVAIASLAFGILSLVFIWANFFDIPFILLGDILGRKARKKNMQDKLARAGIICSTIAAIILIGVISLTFADIFFSAMSKM